jgi:hypothetical protein
VSTTIDLVERLLGNGDPETVLDLADLRSARSLADRVMATDPAAAREFGDAATLTGYLRSIALPMVFDARRKLAARPASPPTPKTKAQLPATPPRPAPAPAPETRSTQPAAAVALADARAEQWGSLDALAKVFQVGSPALRLPTAIAALRGVGIEPKDEDGAERWPLHVALRLSAAKRNSIVLAACSRVFIDSGSLIQIR